MPERERIFALTESETDELERRIKDVRENKQDKEEKPSDKLVGVIIRRSK